MKTKKTIRLFIATTALCSAISVNAQQLPTPQKPPQPMVSIGGIQVTPDDMAHVLIATAEIAENSAKKARAERAQNIQRLEQQLIELGKQRDQARLGATEYAQRCKIIEDSIASLRKEADENAKEMHNVGKNIRTAVLSGWQTVLQGYTEEKQRDTKIAVAAVSEAVKAEKSNEGLIAKTKLELDGSMQRLQFISRPENLKQYAAAASIATVGIVGGYYSIKLVHKYIDMKLNRVPLLVRETSRQSWYAAASTYVTKIFYGKEVPATLDDVIFAPELEQSIKTIAEATKTTHEKGLPYRHLLLYGHPGTGKTKVAKILAQTSGMDYAIMSGADFAQFQEGHDVQALHDLLDWAENQSTKGMIIFIDEADAFLRKRSSHKGDNAERWVKLLDAFLSRTGQPSKNFMFVFALNPRVNGGTKEELSAVENLLDEAVFDRIDKKIRVPLPAALERARIINLYLTKYITHDSRIIKINGKEVEAHPRLAADVTPEFITTIAQQLENFSGRQLEQLVLELQILCYLTNDLIVTKAMIEKSVSEAREQHGRSTKNL